MATIHVSDPGSGSVEDLIELLESSGCEVERIGPRTIRVVSGWVVQEGAAPHTLHGYLSVFEATHPGVRAERVG